MAKLIPILLILLMAYLSIRASSAVSGARLRRQSRPLKNDRLERLLGRLAETAGVDHVRVRVLDQEMINGLATPSGEIYVTRGLVSAVQRGRVTPAEFASVVAHELGHLALGHTKRRMIDVLGAQAATMVVGGLVARFIPVIGWYIARGLANLMVASLSRKDEFEADRYATALMLRAGLGAEPQARMLEKLADLTPGMPQGDGPAGWLASHPPVPERARAIRQNATIWSERDGTAG
jgi:putative metalloprotease